MNKDKKKFGSVQDQVQKRADRIMLQRQKSVEVGLNPGLALCASFLFHTQHDIGSLIRTNIVLQ